MTAPRTDRGPFKALVFDFDGTLVDSGDVKHRAYHAAVDGVLHLPRDACERAYTLYGTLNREPQLISAFIELAGRGPTSDELGLMLATYAEVVDRDQDSLALFPGMRDLLEDAGQDRWLAIASNAPQPDLESACRRLHIDHVLSLVRGYPTSKEVALDEVQKRWGLVPSDLLYIGDRREDAMIARRLGVPFCRFGPLEPDDGSVIVRAARDLSRVIDGA